MLTLTASVFVVCYDKMRIRGYIVYLRCATRLCLGPLLFLIYVNDNSNTSAQLTFVMFADDTNVFMSDASIGELANKINTKLKLVGEWFKANKLSLNPKKTNFILFCSKRKSADISIDCSIFVNIDN